METVIHPTAVISPAAKIGSDVAIGPFCVIEDNSVVGDGCKLQNNVVVRGNTKLGSGVTVFPFSVIGGEPQHSGYKGEPTETIIGDETIIREMVTINRGTTFGVGRTEIGRKCLIMAYCHVAHDCSVGEGVIMANAIHLAGHVQIHDYANIGGCSEVAQFCRVGKYCYVGGSSTIRKDLPPYLAGKGKDFKVQGINSVGLSRHEFSPKTIRQIKNLFKIFFLQNLTVNQSIEKAIADLGETSEVMLFLNFIKSSKVGFER